MLSALLSVRKFWPSDDDVLSSPQCPAKACCKYEENYSSKAQALLAQISPAAWRHIYLGGHYTFNGIGQILDLDTLIEGINLA